MASQDFLKADYLVDWKLNDGSIFDRSILAILEHLWIDPATLALIYLLDFLFLLVFKLSFIYEIDSINWVSLFEDDRILDVLLFLEQVVELLKLDMGHAVKEWEVVEETDLIGNLPLLRLSHDSCEVFACKNG